MRRLVCLLFLLTAAPADAQLRALELPDPRAQVAVSPRGDAIATWPDAQGVWSFTRRRPGGEWAAPAPLPPGTSFPDVRIGPRGDAVAISWDSDGSRPGTEAMKYTDRCCVVLDVVVIPRSGDPLPPQRITASDGSIEFVDAHVDARGRARVIWEGPARGRVQWATVDAAGRLGAPRRGAPPLTPARRAVDRFLRTLARELRWAPDRGPPAAVGPGGRGYVARGTYRRISLLRCRRGCVRVDTAPRRRGTVHWVFGSRDIHGEALVTG